VNRILVVVFENEPAAKAAMSDLQALHDAGSITLYATGLIARDPQGLIALKAEFNQDPVGTGLGFAVGSVIGMLGGPVGVVTGAVAGSVVGAVRDYWVAGVGLDFVEEAQNDLMPGKAAIVAEVEEEQVSHVDTAMAAAGGVVIRRARSEVAAQHLHEDLLVLQSELQSLNQELLQSSEAMKDKLQEQVTAAKTLLDSTSHRVLAKLSMLSQAADAKLHTLKLQFDKAEEEAKRILEQRIARVKAVFEDQRQRLSATMSVASQALIGG